MTQAEIILWKYLSNRGICGFKFRRQYPIDRFVLDFYCPEKRLAIEIDGGIHNNLKEYDQIRQETIESKGIEFLRFKNSEVIDDIFSVLKAIKKRLSLLHEVEKGGPSEARDGMRYYER